MTIIFGVWAGRQLVTVLLIVHDAAQSFDDGAAHVALFDFDNAFLNEF